VRFAGPALTALALVWFAALPAVAAEPRDPAALHDLGLDGLRWGMSPDEVGRAMAGMKAVPNGLEQPLHVFEGCKSRMELEFIAGKLDRIVMIPDADVYSCKINVVDYIAHAYGQPYDVIQDANAWTFKWKGPTQIIFTTTVLENLFKGRLELFDNRP